MLSEETALVTVKLEVADTEARRRLNINGERNCYFCLSGCSATNPPVHLDLKSSIIISFSPILLVPTFSSLFWSHILRSETPRPIASCNVIGSAQQTYVEFRIECRLWMKIPLPTFILAKHLVEIKFFISWWRSSLECCLCSYGFSTLKKAVAGSEILLSSYEISRLYTSQNRNSLWFLCLLPGHMCYYYYYYYYYYKTTYRRLFTITPSLKTNKLFCSDLNC